MHQAPTDRLLIRIEGMSSRFDRFLAGLGLQPVESDIVRPDYRVAPPEVARSLGLATGDRAVRRYRKQSVQQNGQHLPIRLVEIFYPTVLVDETMLAEMVADSSYDAIAAIKSEKHIVPFQIEEEVTARTPTVAEGELLSIPEHTPLLEVRRKVFAEDRDAIMYSRIVCRADHFIFSYSYHTNEWR
jgi:DNA-binding GntR family transcriptional regulator